MNYEEPEQPIQPIEKINDEVLDKFVNTYGFKRFEKNNIASASNGNNIFIIRRKEKNKYSFSIIDKEKYENYRKGEYKDFTFKFIDFNMKYFKKNEQNFIKSINENKMFDDENVKDGKETDFTSRTLPTFTKYTAADRIQKIESMKIPDIQPEPVPEKKDEKELMGDDDEDAAKQRQGFNEDEDEEERMIDEEEEALEKSKPQGSFGDKYKEQVLSANDFKKIIKEEHRKKRKDDFEDNQVFLADEYDKEKEYSDDENDMFKQAKKMKDKKLNKQLAEYNKKFHPKQEIQQKKQRTGLMNEKDNDVFEQLTTELGFTRPKNNAAKSFLRVGDDVIFIRKPQSKKKDSGKLGDNNYLAVKLNKKDFQRMYNKKNVDDIEAEYFNFSTDYFNENKDKFKEAIKKGEFIFDDEIKEKKARTGMKDKLTYNDIMKYDVLPTGTKNFDYIKMFDLKNSKIEDKIEDGQQLIKFSKDGKSISVNIPNKTSYPDSLLKLIVGVSENNKGEVDFKEIGEIQDLNGDITNLYSDMQDLKSKINSSNSEREKERLQIKYNKKRLKLEDLVKKYSKEAYRLSMLNKKKKATFSNPNYIKNKLNKL